MSETVTFTESCGCVFCDLGLEPDDSFDGRPIHRRANSGDFAFCTADHVEATEALAEYHEKGGTSLEELKRELAIEQETGG